MEYYSFAVSILSGVVSAAWPGFMAYGFAVLNRKTENRGLRLLMIGFTVLAVVSFFRIGLVMSMRYFITDAGLSTWYTLTFGIFGVIGVMAQIICAYGMWKLIAPRLKARAETAS